MRKLALASCVVCVAVGMSRADRDDKDVDATLRAVLDGWQPWMLPDGKPGWYERLAGAKVFAPSGAEAATRDALDRELTDCGTNGTQIASIQWKLGAPVIGVDAKHGTAWFQAPTTVDITCMSAGFAPPTAHDALRASGILVREGARWRIAVLALSRPLPDAELIKGATRALPAAEPVLDESAAAHGAAAWFTSGGFARGASKGNLVASGTAPNEYATAASATRLATAWDRLRLRADSIEAIPFGNGAIALVRGSVPFPSGKRAAPMTLFAIAVPDGAGWRWVSLQFATEIAAPPHAETPDTSGIECPHGKC